ncbi:MAG TPA: hypothetical protein VM557_02320 [Thermoanaerobaculia bacterium]|nr:hypothetical protein [Thermoanaerobaculia bacterium]
MNDDRAHYPIGQFRYEGLRTAHQRTGWKVIHPELGKRPTLDWLLAQYSWHGRHHLGHVVAAVERS